MHRAGYGYNIAGHLSPAFKPNTTRYSDGISSYLGPAFQGSASENRDHISGSLATHANGARNANHVANFLSGLHDYVAAYLDQITRLFGGSYA
jgi:hypothetical protein